MSTMIIYFIVSAVIGVVDILRMQRQEDDLLTFPVGDVEEYVEPEPILGIHNLLFLPSLVIIISWIIIVKAINRVFF